MLERLRFHYGAPRHSRVCFNGPLKLLCIFPSNLLFLLKQTLMGLE